MINLGEFYLLVTGSKWISQDSMDFIGCRSEKEEEEEEEEKWKNLWTVSI